jgi:CRISPR-associated endonuclease/helicase Cas3
MDDHGWNPESSEPVVDVSLLSHGLPLDVKTIQMLYSTSKVPIDNETILTAANERAYGDPVDRAGRRAAGEDIVAALWEATPSGYDHLEWEELIAALDPMPRQGRSEVARLHRKKSDPKSKSKKGPWLIRFDASDEISQNKKVSLSQHGKDTMEFANDYARKTGVDCDLVPIASLAAQWHDIGKAEPRFQMWLRADSPDGDELLAKSDTPRHQWQKFRERACWPARGRHEAISGRLVQAWLDSNQDSFNPTRADLLLHLVVSHHGHGRPIILPVADGSGTGAKVSVTMNDQGFVVDTDLSSVDWQQPARFFRLNQHYGYWGLALLETIVRQADWAASGSRLEVR